MSTTQQALQQAHTYMLGELLKCCEAWEPEVCILGNVRAGDAATAIRGAIAALSLPVEAPSEGVLKDAARYRYIVGVYGFTLAEDLFGITTGRNVSVELDAAIDENIEAHKQWRPK